MQIKEFEAPNLKECLQQVRSDLGPEAIILETRKFRKGGVLGWGARDGVCIVAATGITVNEAPTPRRGQNARPASEPAFPRPASEPAFPRATSESLESEAPRADSGLTHTRNGNADAAKSAPTPSQTAAVAAARAAFTRSNGSNGTASPRTNGAAAESRPAYAEPERTTAADRHVARERAAPPDEPTPSTPAFLSPSDAERLGNLERYMNEIRSSLTALQREQREGQERTVTAVVSAVTPALSAANSLSAFVEGEAAPSRFPALYQRLVKTGVAEPLAAELVDSLPDFSAWSEEVQTPLAEAALRDLIARRVASSGPIVLTPGRLKAVALIGPTGVGKTTTIAKLAARYSLVEGKRVALLTVDTYRIAAVEQLKTYSQIIDIPIAVAYSQAEVLPAIQQFADYDLILIDTAGRSQKNLMQVGELKTLLEAVNCETHLALSAQIKEQDMLESVRRFSVARVDRLIFSKLDETSSYGALLNVADATGIPLSYLTTGQKVPEDIEIADGGKLATLLLNHDMACEAVR